MSYQQDFLNRIKTGVMNDCLNKKIIPSIIAAQACLESGYGESRLSINYNNFFGIKDFSGHGANLQTQEEENGVMRTVTAHFKIYENIQDCIADHTSIFIRNSRYASVLKAKNFVDGARALQNSGYATDNEYASKLISICREFNLGQWDKEFFDRLNHSVTPVKAAPVVYTEYKVKSGDSLSKILGNDNAKIKEVVALNHLSDPDLIKVGELLKIPKEWVK